MTTQAREDLTKICQIISKTLDIEKIYLFGSYAYGMPTPDSDYDLCVVIPDNSIRPSEAVKLIRRALFPAQTIPLDVIAYRSSVFRQRQEAASLERKIAREGVLLHEGQRLEQRMA
nr:nucleotidyltransferase domain-containing protein [uncultured Oscillibacter sp.]